jgi:ABC-type transport system substrate-binding protein
VRKAISKAINRQAIAERVMEGQATPASQLVSDKLFGNAEHEGQPRSRGREEAARRSRIPTAST